MKQKLSHIVTSPVAFGVRVEWLWPEGSHWFHRLELQYVRENQIPIVQIIEWPVTGTVISELKAGEKIHVRMRALDKEGNGPDWNTGDWIDAVSSTDAQEIVEHVIQSIKLVSQNPPPSGGYVTPQSYTIRVGVEESGHRHAAGVGIAVNKAALKTRLTDDMREAVIDAVRESDLFKTLQASQDAQISAQVTMQQAIEQAATDAIRDAMKPGGLLYRRIKEVPTREDYVGYSRIEASKKATELTKAAAETGQTLALARHLALLVPIMDGTVEYGKKQVEFHADRFCVTGSAQSIIENAEALASARSVVNEVRICLSEDIQEALNEAMTNWIRKALKPGGLLYRP